MGLYLSGWVGGCVCVGGVEQWDCLVVGRVLVFMAAVSFALQCKAVSSYCNAIQGTPRGGTAVMCPSNPFEAMYRAGNAERLVSQPENMRRIWYIILDLRGYLRILDCLEHGQWLYQTEL